MMHKIKEHKKKAIVGSLVAILLMAFMSLSGCIATYDHKVMGTLESGIHDSYRLELQTDDHIIEMRKLDMKEMKLKK